MFSSFFSKDQLLAQVAKQRTRFLTACAPLCLLPMLMLSVSCDNGKNSKDSSLNVRGFLSGASENTLPFNNFTRFPSEGFDIEITAGKKFTDPITLEEFSPTARNTPVIWIKVSGGEPGTTDDGGFVWVPRLNSRYSPLLGRSLFAWFKTARRNPMTNRVIDASEKLLISNGSTKQEFPQIFRKKARHYLA
jgi:hypothetical protein